MKTYNEIDIKYYDNDGNIQVRCSVPVTQDALVHYELMQSHYCKLSFKLSKPIYFLLGDFIDTPYGRFELIDLAKAKDNDTIGYSYEIQFDAYYRKFKNKILKYRPNTGSQEATFSLTSTISTHVEVIMKSLAYYAKLDKSYLYDSKFDGEGTDYTYVIDASVDANAAKLITYSNSSMLDAIANIAQTFGCEWWFEGNILHFGTCENTNAITDFRLNDNIVSMSSSQSQSTYANRVYAFGAARNLPSGYRNDADADITKDGVVEKRLMLPNSAECSDKNKQLLAENGFELKNGYIQVSGLREDQYVEGVTTNDDIYPRNLIKTSKVTSYEKDVEDESTPEEGDFIKRTFYRVNSLSIINEDGEKTGDMAFRKSYILSGKNLHIVFQSGSLNGMDFECEFNPDGVEEILKDDDGNPILKDGKEQINPMSQVFEIVANEDYGRFLPDITLHPKDGDTFVLYNWDSTKLGDTLVSSASNELLTDAIKDLKKSMIDPTTYTCTAEANYSYNQGRGNLHGVGDRVNLYNKGYGDSHRSSRVIGYEFCLDIPYDGAKYYVGEKPSYSRLNAMESKIEELVYNGQSYLNGNGGGGKSIYIIKSYDKTAPTDYNVYSAKAIDEQRLNRTKDDTAHGTITFEKVQKFLQGLNIGEGNGTWSADGTLSLFKLLTNNFDSGLYGHGAQIDEKGDMEVNSIYARKFISAPKFVFNEISVTKAEQWNTNGYGTIESVDVKNRTITLHLEENDYGSLQVGDICRGLYADIDNIYSSDKTEEGALDDCNFVQHKGFFSTYFYVSHIITSEKGKFVFQYGKRSSVTPDPCAYMDFAQYGSFTDDKRQSSMYFSSRGNSFIEVLDGVNTWEVQSQNRVARYGWLGGLALVKKDGSIVRPEGNGIYVQDNIYFGGNINYLQGLSGLDDLREEAKAYDVSLSQYQSVITVDDMGNVINGLYTEDEEKTTKQYRISTAVFVRKGMDILLEEDGNTEDVTAGHYRVHAVSEDCEVMVQNSTIFVTAIRNIKDGVAGTKDDATFDYDAMRKATDAMVTIVVELEGKTSKMVQMPIRIQHDTLPFMVCDLSNESASVAWNTKTAKYIGLPIKTKVSLMYHNEPWTISRFNISKVAGLKTSMSIEGKAKVITIDADNLTDDTLAQVTKMNITVVGRYAGANYEYTRELTILKSSDTVVYELIPSADSIVVDKDGGTSVNFVSCDVYATSSDDKRYKLTALPSGMSLKYGKSENATKDLALDAGVDVTSDDKMVTFALYDSNNNILDKESVPVLAFGKDGKGIEYIFKLQNSAPSNPTPSDYATNTEYQRTDKEFVPSGWTDDPTGVDAVNLYEWVSKRVSVNGHWGAFSEPAEYAHFGKHAPKAKSSDDIVTIPTDSDGNALLAFREEVGFSILVDGHECNISSIQKYSSTLSNVSCSISGNVATITCEEGAALGITSQTIVFKVTGTLDGSTYIDYVTVKIVPNVTGADGDGYEYIYYQSNYLHNNFSAPNRTNGKLTDGWQDDLMAPTEDKRYVFVAYKQGEVGSDGEFSMPQLFNRYPKSIVSQETKFIAWYSLTDAPKANYIWDNGSTTMPTNFSDAKPWLWKVVRTNYTEDAPEYTVSCEGYKAKDGHSLLVGYQSSASEPSVLPTSKTLADYDNAQDNIGNGWAKTAPATGGKSIVLGGKITTNEIVDRYNSSTNAWGTEESEILLDGIKQKKTFYKTPSSLGNDGKCIRRIKVVNHFRDSYLRVMLKSYSEANYDLVCISRLYLPSEVINDKGNQLKTDDEYLSKSKYAYEVSGDGQSLVAELSMPDAGEYYFFIGYFKDGSNDSYGDYGLFAWQAMIALTESLWRTDGTVDDASNITWSKAMPMQAEAIVMERAYIATANDTSVPAKPYRTNGILQGGWTAKRLAVSSTNRFIWESVRTGKHGTDSVQDDWSQPVVVANFAEAGKMGKNGCIVRNSEGWKSGATYHNDSALTKEQKYIDLIYIEDNNANDGWSIYQCNVTHTATGSSFDPSAVDADKNKLWTKLSDAGPMYSPLIVAKNAVLKFAQGQQFNLMEGNNIFGSFRWVKDDADYAFWIGGASGAAATTSITRGGKLKSTSAEITGKITATSGLIGGFKLEDNNLVCSNARLTIGEESNNFTRMVVLDAKSFTYASYNFALSVVNYGIVTQSSATQAGIHINVGASNASVQYPGIVMENGTFVGFRVPIVPLSYSMDLRNNASIYASGMCIRCNNSSNITITLPTSATGAKKGDVFTVIRAGTGDVIIKAPAGVSYRTSNGKTGEFTSTKKDEQIHLIFDGDTWFSECSNG
nr:MAG TPA: tail protein [Caudoviricetes sp.]